MTMRTYLHWIGRHQLAVSAIATICAVVSLVLNPGDVWAWIVVALAAAWLAVTINRYRRGAA
jgi:hypothetical protein